uniref:FAD-binding FR-type domain-containing protein n=2 Tax=Physcomitrium patens TaxID=3218 RepID=A0A7I4BC66_PHYPA
MKLPDPPTRPVIVSHRLFSASRRAPSRSVCIAHSLSLAMAAVAAIAVTSAPFAASAAPSLRVDAVLPRPAMSSTRIAFARPALGLFRRLKVPEERAWGLRGGVAPRRGARGVAAVRAVWKQEVLWAEAPVADVALACEEHYHFVLDVSGNRELMEGHTKAGQFVQVKFGDSKPAFLAIASAPKVAASGSMEFLIKAVEGTTAGMLCSLGKGDKVELSQVMGSGFRMDQVAPAEDYSTILLFATGSGISPIRSLLEAGFDAHKRKDVRLYYGARNLDRMSYQDRFKDWEASGVQVIPVLSQPTGPWNGAQGYVQAAFSNDKGSIVGSQTGAVLCGHKQMALDVTDILLAAGVAKEKILLNF